MNELIIKENEFLNNVSVELTQRLVNERKAVGDTFNTQRFVMNSLEALKQLELINKPIEPKQVVDALMKGAYLNLDFFRRECYLIYYNGKGLQFQTDYKGELKLVKKYSIKPIYEIYAEVVREGDEYEKVINNGCRTINHKPLSFSDDRIRGAYAHVRYKDGSTDLVDISAKDIETIRNKYSKAPNSGAWMNRYEEMCKKTVLRLLCKSIQLDFSTEQYLAYNEAGDCEFDKNKTNEAAINPFEVEITPSSTIEEKPQEEPREEPQEELPASSQQLECSKCGATISEKVYAFSVDKFAEPLCYKCQKGVKNG